MGMWFGTHGSWYRKMREQPDECKEFWCSSDKKNNAGCYLFLPDLVSEMPIEHKSISVKMDQFDGYCGISIAAQMKLGSWDLAQTFQYY